MNDNMNRFAYKTLMVIALAAAATQADAQYTQKVARPMDTLIVRDINAITPASIPAETRRTLFINKDITTFIVSGDEIKLMDISLDSRHVVGNQPSTNIVRIKPVKDMPNGADLGVLTVVAERNITQFNLIYVDDSDLATTQYNIRETDGVSYLNPGVDMPKRNMYMYCWRIINSGRKFYDVSAGNYGIKIRLNNIYSIGNYFFIDFSLSNRTNIRFDIEEIRIKLTDKKRTKATNSQDIELEPALNFNTEKKFKRDWRNVVVLPKMTFPDEKVLTITVNEEQISGRTTTLSIDYQDILNADGYSHSMD